MGINLISTKNVNGLELGFGSGFESSLNGLSERAERVCTRQSNRPVAISWAEWATRGKGGRCRPVGPLPDFRPTTKGKIGNSFFPLFKCFRN
jgi:hypothetical protein